MCVAEKETWREEGRLSVMDRQAGRQARGSKGKRDKETGQQGCELIYRFTCVRE